MLSSAPPGFPLATAQQFLCVLLLGWKIRSQAEGACSSASVGWLGVSTSFQTVWVIISSSLPPLSGFGNWRRERGIIYLKQLLMGSQPSSFVGCVTGELFVVAEF